MVGWAHSWYLPGSGAVHNKQAGPLLGGAINYYWPEKATLDLRFFPNKPNRLQSSLAVRFLSNWELEWGLRAVNMVEATRLKPKLPSVEVWDKWPSKSKSS